MPKETQHDIYVAALQVEGCQIVTNARTGKYTVLTRPKQAGTYYYVGSAGAVRFGRTVSGSLPISKVRKMQLVQGLVDSRKQANNA